MRNPENILNSLAEHSKEPHYKYNRLYRILYNSEMFVLAYCKTYANKGSMTAGADESTVDDMSLKRIDALIERLKDETYQPLPVRRTYIPKKNGKMRPLGIPSADDKLVQEVLRMVLEAIYEGQFSNTSHGFRPKRSCHTALAQLRASFTGAKWFIEGDIKSYFDTIDHHVLMNILSERIDDQKFLRLIWKFLRAGYLENWSFNTTYSGVPQGGIVSPILANIYLDKLDKYMETYAETYNSGNARRKNPEYRRMTNRKTALSRELAIATLESRRTEIETEIRQIDMTRRTIPAGIPDDGNYKRLYYVRYADDFIIGVIGSKEDCRNIKSDIRSFLQQQLKLELSEEKTLITHSSKPAKFLGYEITVPLNNLAKRDKRGYIKRDYTGRVTLKINSATIRKKLLELEVIELTYPNGIEVWKPKQKGKLINNDDLEILEYYNSLIRGFYNYYSLAINSAIIGSFAYMLEYSMYKTFAGKYRTSKSKIMQKYRIGKDFGVKYSTSSGETKVRLFYNEGFKHKNAPQYEDCDTLPNPNRIHSRIGLEQKLKAGICEWCGATDCEIHVHHVHKLKDLKGKKAWERFMIMRRRKTLALCQPCHAKLHAGKLD